MFELFVYLRHALSRSDTELSDCQRIFKNKSLDARWAYAKFERPTKMEETMVAISSRMTLAGVSILALLAMPSIASAETITYKVNLKSSEEVPPNPSPATRPLWKRTYDTASKQLSYTANYSGLAGNATMAHFHGPADAGKNAPVVIPVQGSVASPIKGTATLTDAQAAELMAGKLYFNIHTEANKGGEIRGQVVK